MRKWLGIGVLKLQGFCLESVPRVASQYREGVAELYSSTSERIL